MSGLGTCVTHRYHDLRDIPPSAGGVAHYATGPVVDSKVEDGLMVTATATRRWVWFNYGFLAFPLGGVAMLVTAPFASQAIAASGLVSG